MFEDIGMLFEDFYMVDWGPVKHYNPDQLKTCSENYDISKKKKNTIK